MKNRFTLIGLFATILLLLSSCTSSDKNHGFPMDKKYWTAEDYNTANNIITSLFYNKSELPNLDNSETSAIFNKIIDTANIAVIANDNELGLIHRGEFLKSMFDEYKDLASRYVSLDKQDKYVYPVEYVKILKFGLYLQVPYIQVNNEKILKEATNPDDEETKRVVHSNEQVLINNYNIYLDHINYEDRFNEKAIIDYSQGIDDYFPKLITEILPNGNYSGTLELVQNMLKKAKNTSLIQALQNIEMLIKAKNKL